MKHSAMRRIPPAKAAVRPSINADRGFGPLGCAKADSGVGEGRHSLDAAEEQITEQCAYFISEHAQELGKKLRPPHG